MLCALRLHAAGVTHCDLINGHHFVLQGAEIRIVDFSLAIRHVCTPLPMQRGIRQATDCTELQNMKELYGRFSNEVTHGIDRSIQH